MADIGIFSLDEFRQTHKNSTDVNVKRVLNATSLLSADTLIRVWSWEAGIESVLYAGQVWEWVKI